jgi:hypothetical protein
LPLSGVDLLEKQTKPKPLHTESSLLAAMENAGRELEDAELKASLKFIYNRTLWCRSYTSITAPHELSSVSRGFGIFALWALDT